MDVEWAGIGDKVNEEESSDSSEHLEELDSDFESICSKEDDGEQIVERVGQATHFMLGQCLVQNMSSKML